MDWTESLALVIERTGHRRYADLCADGHPDHAEWRRRMVEKATVEASTPAAYPPLFRQAANLANAVGRVAAAAARGEAVMVPAEEYARRLAICGGCEKFDKQQSRCTMCGCYSAAKLRLETESCPVGKW